MLERRIRPKNVWLKQIGLRASHGVEANEDTKQTADNGWRNSVQPKGSATVIKDYLAFNIHKIISAKVRQVLRTASESVRVPSTTKDKTIKRPTIISSASVISGFNPNLTGAFHKCTVPCRGHRAQFPWQRQQVLSRLTPEVQAQIELNLLDIRVTA
jgi:hypothetical protein